MKYLKSFNESNMFLSDEREIEEFVDKCGVRRIDFTINPDGSVDVRHDVLVSGRFLGSLERLPVKFRNVGGDFAIHNAPNLTTLEGSPDSCGGFFEVTGDHENSPTSYPDIKDLRGGPKFVGGDYFVRRVPITSLEGAPESCGGRFDCSETKITSLKGAPKEVGNFLCDMTSITDLVGGPERVNGHLHGRFTKLTSVEGAPKFVTSIRVWTKNNTLWDPGDIRNSSCQNLTCMDDPLEEIIELFNYDVIPYERLSSENKNRIFELFKDSLDYNYIRKTSSGRPQIILFKLREALDELGIEEPPVTTPPDFPKHWDIVDEEGRRVDFWGRPK